MQTWITNYLAAQKRTIDSIPADAVERIVQHLRRAFLEQRQIFCIGNGGSAANSSHFATDLGKCSSDALGKPFRVHSLTDNTPWMTALGNDYAFEDIFLRQLKNYGQPDDVVIGVSVSGNSPNLVKALEWARAQVSRRSPRRRQTRPHGRTRRRTHRHRRNPLRPRRRRPDAHPPHARLRIR
jgi:D-sedoheptulose 7-phosphate isomerase